MAKTIIMEFNQLTPEEKEQFKNGVIQVNGKAMNRTALGIIAAYFKLNPNTTFKELKEAFPDSINPSGPRAPKTIFKPFTERNFGVVHSLTEIKKEFGAAGLPYEGLFFLEKDEMFKTSDGVQVVVNRLWESKDTETGESDLENLAKAAIKYGIVVNKFEARTPFSRGSYSLDILEPEIFNKLIAPIIIEKEVIKERTVIPWWIWLVLALALIPLLLWLFGAFKSEPEVVKTIVEKEVIVTDTIVQTIVDTVYVAQLEEIEAKFNAVQFEVAKADLPEESKYALYDLAKLMEKHSELEVKIEGHTSDEGDSDFNEKLSERRAKAVVDFLIERGVEKDRLQWEGKGSREPIDPNNREINRRTEFNIIE